MEYITLFIVGFFFIWFCLVLPYQMAYERGRCAGCWLLVSIIFSPILAIILLLIIGNSHEWAND